MTETSKFSIIENSSKKLYGIQFHPEVTHTEKGKIILKNFIFKICETKKNWSSKNQKKILIEDVKRIVSNSKVICALSAKKEKHQCDQKSFGTHIPSCLGQLRAHGREVCLDFAYGGEACICWRKSGADEN